MSKGKMKKSKTGKFLRKKEVKESVTPKKVVAKRSNVRTKTLVKSGKLNAIRTSKPSETLVKHLNLEYVTEDHILGQLALPDPCPVKVIINPEHAILQLFVGQRDFQWSMETGELVACGTKIDNPYPDETPATTASTLEDPNAENDDDPEDALDEGVPAKSLVEEDEEKIVS